MMGREVCDPDHVEGDIERLPGLGLLPVSTRLTKEKTTRQVSFRMVHDPRMCRGYEIHMGETRLEAGASDVLPLTEGDGVDTGWRAGERCMGSYIHGILDNASAIDCLLRPVIGRIDTRRTFDYAAFKEEQYDRLADHVRRHVDMAQIYGMMKKR